MKVAESKDDRLLLPEGRALSLYSISSSNHSSIHSSCRGDYTLVLLKNRCPQCLTICDSVYESESLKTFCEIIEGKLLKQCKILRMTKFNDIFIEILE